MKPIDLKYKENGNVDYKASIIAIISSNPGCEKFNIADAMFNKEQEPNKHAYVSEVLGKMVKNKVIIKDGMCFYNVDVENKENEENEEHDNNFESPRLKRAYEARLAFPNSSIKNEVEFKYDEAGKLDVIDTIIAIVSKNPGSTGISIAEYISNHHDIEDTLEVLDAMSNEADDVVLINNEGIYFLFADALKHDMDVTVNVMNDMKKEGAEFDKTTFLMSGIVMAAEQAQAHAEGQEYDPMETSAADPVTVDDEQFFDEDDEDVPTPNWHIDDTMDNNEHLVNKANNLIEKNEKKETPSIKTIKTAQDLLGLDVEIQPDIYVGKLIGTIIELRPTGVSFFVTKCEGVIGISDGTILNYEYSEGVTYKLIG